MKTNFVIILLIVIGTSSSMGQDFLGSNVNAKVDSEILTIDQVASFSFGFEDFCPSLQYEIHTSNENIIVELFYDITGAWPQVGCSRYDQIIVNPFDSTICNLSVRTNIITYDVMGTGTDTIFEADLDTFNFCETGVEQYLINQNISIFPNPAIDKLSIECPGNLKFNEITINDLNGNQVKSLNSDMREFSLGNIASGIYIIQIRTEEKVIRQKLIIE